MQNVSVMLDRRSLYDYKLINDHKASIMCMEESTSHGCH